MDALFEGVRASWILTETTDASGLDIYIDRDAGGLPAPHWERQGTRTGAARCPWPEAAGHRCRATAAGLPAGLVRVPAQLSPTHRNDAVDSVLQAHHLEIMLVWPCGRCESECSRPINKLYIKYSINFLGSFTASRNYSSPRMRTLF